MKSILHPSYLLLTLTLSACGGDGGVAPKKPVTSPVASSPAPEPGPSDEVPGPPASGAMPASQTCSLAGFQQELMNRVNQARANTRMCGGVLYDSAAPVTWSAPLFQVAAMHSADMSSNNYFSHNSLDGHGPGDRISASAYAWKSYAENIAAGQTTVDQVMNDWLASAGHCANIMRASVTEMGVACVEDDASTYGMYWTMDFARPR